MKRGRPRKLNPGIPAHIDQHRIPKGVYWHSADRYWYTIIQLPKPHSRKIAGADALLSDLHVEIEKIAGVERSSLGYLLEQFHGSADFKGLMPATKHDYERQRLLCATTNSRVGQLTVLRVSGMSTAFIQQLIDSVAKGSKVDGAGVAIGTPSKANHLLRYLRRVFHWGVTRGLCASNPAKGVYQAKERKRRRLPAPDVYAAVARYAYAGGQLVPRTPGSCAPYLWMVMEIGMLCRLRPVETLTLTDANLLTDGVMTNRRKGSRDNIVKLTPRLRLAVNAALELRKRYSTTVAAIRAQDRPLFLSADGAALSKSGLDSAWQRLMRTAVAAGVITTEQRFGLHDLKRKGITDTKGTRAQKQQASGHREESMLDVYDLDVPLVMPAGE